MFIFTFKDHNWNIKSLSGDLEDFFYGSRVVFFTFLVILIIAHFAYRFVCKIYGGTYKWEYEMDDEQFSYWQPADQAEITKKIGEATAIAGAISGSPGTAAVGLNTAYTDGYTFKFASIRKIRAYRKSNLIVCRAIFMHHMIYVGDEDFDWVLNYLKEHCVKAK